MVKVCKFMPMYENTPLETRIECISVHPGMEYLAAYVDNDIYYWSFREMRPPIEKHLEITDLHEFKDDVDNLAFSVLKMPGKLIIGTMGGDIIAVNNQKKIIWKLHAHEECVNDIVYIPPLDAIVSISDDNKIIAWNKVDFVKMYEMTTENSVLSLDGSHDGCFLVALAKESISGL